MNHETTKYNQALKCRAFLFSLHVPPSNVLLNSPSKGQISIQFSNSEREGKYISQCELEIVTRSSHKYSMWERMGLFTTKVIKSHVKLHMKSDAQKVN